MLLKPHALNILLCENKATLNLHDLPSLHVLYLLSQKLASLETMWSATSLQIQQHKANHSLTKDSKSVDVKSFFPHWTVMSGGLRYNGTRRMLETKYRIKRTWYCQTAMKDCQLKLTAPLRNKILISCMLKVQKGKNLNWFQLLYLNIKHYLIKGYIDNGPICIKFR